MTFLSVEELLHVAQRVLGEAPGVRDVGLLESAAARPATTVFGDDAYPSDVEKAAALLHSLVQNHALVDGNKRLGLAATIVFLAINGHRFVASNDDAYDLVIAIASGELSDVDEIAGRLRPMVVEL